MGASIWNPSAGVVPPLIPGIPTAILPNLFQFGTVGDGVIDDRPVIQAVIDYYSSLGGGTIFAPTPPVYYRLSGPLYARPNVHIIGDGPSSLFYNDKQTSTVFGDQQVFCFGTYNPTFLNAATFYTLSAINNGDTVLTFPTAGQSNLFSVGMTVGVVDSFEPGSNSFVPGLLFWCKVIAIGSNSITVDTPLDSSIATPSIMITDGLTDYTQFDNQPEVKNFVSYNFTLSKVACKSDGFWTADSSTLRCKLEDILVEGTCGIYGNGFQYTDFIRITAKSSRIFSELSMCSLNVNVLDCIGDVIDPNVTNFQLIELSENGRNIVFDNCKINAPTFRQFSPVIRMTGTNSQVRNSVFNIPSARGNIVSFESLALNNKVENCQFNDSSAAARAINFDQTTVGNELNDCRFTATSYVGTNTFNGTGNKVQRNIFPATTAFQLTNTAVKGTVVGNRLSSFGWATANGVIVFTNNFIHGNETIRGTNLRAAQQNLLTQVLVSSNTSGNVVSSSPLNFPSFGVGDGLKQRTNVIANGTAGTKELRWLIGGVVFGSLSIPQANTGNPGGFYSIDITLDDIDTTALTGRIIIYNSAGITVARAAVSGLNFVTTSYTIDFQVWCAASGDTVTVYNYDSEITSLGAAVSDGV